MGEGGGDLNLGKMGVHGLWNARNPSFQRDYLLLGGGICSLLPLPQYATGIICNSIECQFGRCVRQIPLLIYARKRKGPVT